MPLSGDQEAVTDSVAGVPIKKRKYVAGVPLKKRHYFLADLSTTSTQLSSSPKEPGLSDDQQIIPESKLSLSGLTELSLTSSQLSSPVPQELGLPTEEQSVSESKLPLSGLTELSLTSSQLSSSVPQELGLPTKEQSVSESKLPLSGLTELSLTSSQLSSSVPQELGLPTKEQSVSESKLPLSGVVHDINPQTTGLADEEHASIGQPVTVKCEKSCRVEDAVKDNMEVAKQVELSAQKLCAGETVNYELGSDPREKVPSTSVPVITELVSTSEGTSMMQFECSKSGEKPVTGFMCKAEKLEEITNIQMSLGESFGLHNEKLLQEASNCSLNLGQYQTKLDFPISSIRDGSIPGKGLECDSQVDNGSGLAHRSHWDLNTTMDTWDGPVGDSKKKLQIESASLQPNGLSVGNCSLGLVKEKDGRAAGQGISIALGKDIGQNGSTLNLSSSPSLASKELEKNQAPNYLCSSEGSENLIPEMSLHLQLNPPCTFGLHSKAISSQQEAASHSLSGSGEGSSLTMSVEAISQTKNLNLPHSRTVKPEPVEDNASGGTLKMLEASRQSIPSQGAVKSEPPLVGSSDAMQPVVFHNVKPEPVDEIGRKLDKCVESSPAVCGKLSIKLNIQDNISIHTSSMNGGNASSHTSLFDMARESIGSATNEPLVRSTNTSAVERVNASVGESIAVSEQHRNPYSSVDDAENKEEVKLAKSQEPFWVDGGYEKFNDSLVYTDSTTKSHDADDDFEDGEFREARHVNEENMTPEFVVNNYQDPAEGQCSTSLDSENAASARQHRKTLSEDKDLTNYATFGVQKDKIGVLNKVSVINPVKNVISVKKPSTNVVNAMDIKKVTTLVTKTPSSRGISAGDVHKSESTKKKPVRTMQKIQQNTSNRLEFVSTGMTSDQTADAAKKLAQERSAPSVSGIQTSSVETANAKLGKIGEPFKEEPSVNCEELNKGTNCNVNRSRIITLPRNNSSSFSSRIDGDRCLEKTNELQSRGNREEGRKKVFHKMQRVRNQDQPSGVSNSDSACARGRFDGCINSSHEKWTLNRDYVSEQYSSASVARFSGPRSAIISVSSVLEADNYTRRDRSSFNTGVRSERKLSNDELLDFSCLPPRRRSPVDRDVEPGLIGMRMCQGSMREVSPDRFVGRSQRDYDRDEPFVRRERSFSPLQRSGTCRMSGLRTRSPPRPRNCSPGPRSSPRKRSPDRMGRHHVMKEERMRSPQRLFEDMVGSRLRGSPLRQRLPTDIRSISSPRHREAGRSFVPNRSPTDRVLHRSNSRYEKIDHRGREDEYLESMHSGRFHEFAESECLDDEGRGTSGRFRHAHSFRSFNDDSDYEDFRYGMDGARPCRPSPESDIDYHDRVSARGFEGRIRKGMGYHPRRLRSVEEGEDNVRCNQRWLESSFSEERQKRRRF